MTTAMIRSSLEKLSESLQNLYERLSRDEHLARHTALASCCALAITIGLRYRRAIRARLRSVKEDSVLFGALMERGQLSKDVSSSPNAPWASLAHTLELNPEFKKQHQDQYQLASLGEYLASLRPAMVPNDVELPVWIQSEIEATISAVLLKAMGPYMGGALLPVLGTVDSKMSRIASALSSMVLLASDVEKEYYRGGMPLSLFTITALSTFNARVNNVRSTKNAGQTSLDKMNVGEVGYDPSFGGPIESTNKDDEMAEAQGPEQPPLVPNPFVLSEHWDGAIARMERVMRETHGDSWDPNDRSMPVPTPVNERLLPDLHFGWGKAKTTHTKRDILRNRLLAVLLNRLGHNYYISSEATSLVDDNETPQLFRVQIDVSGDCLDNPADLIQALIETGHNVQVCPRLTITTFGMGLCVKERDGTWTNLPLAAFLESGYESQDGRRAMVCMPHGGVDLDITGPLFGDSPCNIQHYLAIEGLCGWHSNHNADVPWLKPVSCGEPWRGEKAVHAVRIAGLVALTTNALGTELELPFGGYGLIGVCNDSAGIVEHAMEGRTHVHPLTSSGRFLLLGMRRVRRLRDAFEAQQGRDLEREISDLNRILCALTQSSSDLHASPACAIDSASRMLHCLPSGLPFQLSVEAKEIMEHIKAEHEQYNGLCSL